MAETDARGEPAVSAPDGVPRLIPGGPKPVLLVVDAGLRIITSSPAADEFFAAEPGSLRGRPFPELCADERSRSSALLSVEFAQQMRGRTQQVDVLTADDRVLRADLAVAPVHGSSASLVKVELRDVRRDYRARRELIASEQRYRQLAQNLPNMAVALFDRDLRMLVVEGDPIRADGNDPNTMTGLLLHETVGPEVFGLLEGPYRAATQGRSSELTYIDPATGRQYRTRVRPFTDPDGRIVGGLSVSEDITADGARQAQLEQIRQLTLVGSGVYDARSGWTFDDDLMRLWGFEGPYDSHTFRHVLVVPEDRDRANAAWDGVYAHGGQVTVQYRMHHGITGELRHVECTFEGRLNQHGVLATAVVTHIDVTGSVTAREAEASAVARAATGRTTLLRQVSDLLGSSRQDVEQVTQSITELAAAVLGDGAVLRILTPDRQAVERDVTAHRDAALRGRLASAVQRSAPTFEVRSDVRRQVVLNGSLVSTLQPSEEAEEYRRLISARLGEQVAHLIVAPVRHQGLALGLLAVLRPPSQPAYQPGDDDMVQILADRIGAAITASRASDLALQERAQRDAVSDRLEVVNAEQRQLLQHLAQTESRERSLLAEAVHDDPLQLVVAAILRVDLLRMRVPEEEQEMDSIATLLETSVDRLRQLIVALAPLDLSEGLGAALRQLADGIFIGTGVEVRQLGPPHVNLTPDAKAAAYRVVREALVNVRKHARAHAVTIALTERADEVVVTVTDDGVGAATLDAGPGHLGLPTMRARARAEGAHLRIESVPGQGTTVALALRRC